MCRNGCAPRCSYQSKGEYSRHHYFPVSRYPSLKGEPWNIVLVHHQKHLAWHRLFGNATPFEVIQNLQSGEFQFDAFNDARWKDWKFLFTSDEPSAVIEEILANWCPQLILT